MQTSPRPHRTERSVRQAALAVCRLRLQHLPQLAQLGIANYDAQVVLLRPCVSERAAHVKGSA